MVRFSGGRSGSVADKQVGMIVYDASNDSFKGLDRSGNWDTLAQANASQVTSSASGVKVEYAAMSSVCSVNGACTLNSNRSSSNITITRTALGTYTVNLLNSIFTYAPVCTATMEYQTGLSGWTLSTNSTSSSTAFYLSFGYWTGTTLGSADGQIDVVCVGR